MFKRWWRSIIWRNPEGNNNRDNRTALGNILYQLIGRKPLRDIIAQTNEEELTRLLGFFSLNTLGLGAIIGKIAGKAKLFFELDFTLTVSLLFIRCWYLHFGGLCCCKFFWSS
jgi:hypothetical protein